MFDIALSPFRVFAILLVTIVSATLLPSPAKASIPPIVLINEVSLNTSPDWAELYVTEDTNLSGIRVYEGSSTLVKEIPKIEAKSGDYLILHFNDSLTADETDVSGKGSNNVWDLYTPDKGLTKTDGMLRIQQPGTTDVSLDNTLDVFIWSDNNGSYSAGTAAAQTAADLGLWNESDFALSDADGWNQTSLINKDQTIGRDEHETDTNAKTDWSYFEYPTPGTANIVIYPTPTEAVTPKPSPTITPSPTPTPAKNVPVIEIEIPKSLSIDSEFKVVGQITSSQPSTIYRLKLEGSLDQNKWYEAKTQNEAGEFLAWNTGWASFPKATTNADGRATFELNGRIRETTEPGSIFLRLKIKPESSDVNYLSEVASVTLKPKTTSASISEITTNENANPETADDTKNTEPENIALMLIADVREQLIGSLVKVEGVVISPPEQLGSRTMYIEDESGGVKILLNDKDRDDIAYGDLVEVVGKIGESFNELYIKPENSQDLKVLGQSTLPDPIFVETGMIGEESEGRLVLTVGQVTATSGNTFYLDDGSGNIKVYIKDSTEIEKPPMRKGYYAAVIGVANQYKDEYRLLPRFNNDLIVSETPIETGEILAATDLAYGFADVTELPRTANSHGGGGFLLIWLGLIFRRIAR